MRERSRPNATNARGPSARRAIGDVQRSCPLLCRSSVLDEILDYSGRDQRRERGGFLVGQKISGDQPRVEIRHFVPAIETISQAARMQFTHETWARLNREMASQFPDECVVGWHHTHPGLGVFLSAYDEFIHRHFFSQPWQVAMVVDPRAMEFGFFQWNGEGSLVDVGFVLY
ncbi:MAG: Mov34/MPN/PAD-1 family protein [Planctomycetales bacterium]|nr:Mov34/MPN/PAD-1 family protein [Planctomycetales bacterium]